MTDQKWCHAHMIGWFNDGPCPDCAAGVQATYPFYQQNIVAAQVAMSVDANGSPANDSVLHSFMCPQCKTELNQTDVPYGCWRCGQKALP